jgi:hypothetical protein
MNYPTTYPLAKRIEQYIEYLKEHTAYFGPDMFFDDMKTFGLIGTTHHGVQYKFPSDALPAVK